MTKHDKQRDDMQILCPYDWWAICNRDFSKTDSKNFFSNLAPVYARLLEVIHLITKNSQWKSEQSGTSCRWGGVCSSLTLVSYYIKIEIIKNYFLAINTYSKLHLSWLYYGYVPYYVLSINHSSTSYRVMPILLYYMAFSLYSPLIL